MHFIFGTCRPTRIPLINESVRISAVARDYGHTMAESIWVCMNRLNGERHVIYGCAKWTKSPRQNDKIECRWRWGVEKLLFIRQPEPNAKASRVPLITTLLSMISQRKSSLLVTVMRDEWKKVRFRPINFLFEMKNVSPITVYYIHATALSSKRSANGRRNLWRWWINFVWHQISLPRARTSTNDSTQERSFFCCLLLRCSS